jgi:lincosamide nucleotidyltransferase A/C/D/E
LKREMTEQDVLRVLDLCDDIALDVIVDGGWGVDALLGHQTRAHADLDVALAMEDVPRLRAALEAHGYVEVPHSDSSPWQFVLRDGAGHEVDIHGFSHDDEGKHVAGVAYVCESLNGTGHIGGRAVRCITAEWVVRYHTHYEPDADDWRDVRALCEAFDLELPELYREFEA